MLPLFFVLSFRAVLCSFFCSSLPIFVRDGRFGLCVLQFDGCFVNAGFCLSEKQDTEIGGSVKLGVERWGTDVFCGETTYSFQMFFFFVLPALCGVSHD